MWNDMWRKLCMLKSIGADILLSGPTFIFKLLHNKVLLL